MHGCVLSLRRLQRPFSSPSMARPASTRCRPCLTTTGLLCLSRALCLHTAFALSNLHALISTSLTLSWQHVSSLLLLFSSLVGFPTFSRSSPLHAPLNVDLLLSTPGGRRTQASDPLFNSGLTPFLNAYCAPQFTRVQNQIRHALHNATSIIWHPIETYLLSG